jgi:small subunit ribosomal protein S1
MSAEEKNTPESANNEPETTQNESAETAKTGGVVIRAEEEDTSVVRRNLDVVDEVVVDDEDEEEVNLFEEEEEAEHAHDDFDWELANKTTDRYTAAERATMTSAIDSSLTAVAEFEIIEGVIKAEQAGDYVLDINYKSDGLVGKSEFRDQPNLVIGDTVEVYVEELEDERGQLVLSRRKAKLLRAWDTIVDSYKNGTVIKGTVVSKTKGGLIVDAHGLETFLPGSQIDIKTVTDFDHYVGKTMEFKVVKINETIKNAVVSHKALIESDLAEQREAIIASLEKGQVLEGIVKNITDFGAFLDLGGVDGLLYITDISWGRIKHPSEVVEVGQKLNVAVLDFDENKKRISLGLKQLMAHPWDTLSQEITEGSTVKGRIVNIEDYGAFLEIMPGVEGLIHVSEVTWSNQPVNARDYFSVDATVEAKVVSIDPEERKMSLSIKQLQEDPWDKVFATYPEGSRHSVQVKNLTPYGVFVELEEGIGGMVHISDLSWTKRFNHPSEFTKTGEQIDVMVLNVDGDNRKISLGVKQLEENPWDTFAQVFPEGSFHEATVLRKDDRVAILQLPYGLEAFSPLKHMRKEDGTTAEVDETLQVKVVEFNRDDKRIMVSHSRVVDSMKRESRNEERKAVQEERDEVRKVVRRQAQNIERATLGDLDALSQLRTQLEGGDDVKKEEE